jgi:transposase InsO family protein
VAGRLAFSHDSKARNGRSLAPSRLASVLALDVTRYVRASEGLVVLRHDRREIVSFAVTRHPTAEWLARQVSETFPWDSAPCHLIRDRDRSYGEVFLRRLQSMGIRDRPIAPRSPWQNPYVERLIGSIRRECLDHLIIFNEAHLCRALSAYATYYNAIRTHLALDKDAPLGRCTRRAGPIRRVPHVGGLHHAFVRI